MTGQTQSPLANLKIPYWAALLILAIAPGILFLSPLLSGKTIGPFDQMAHMVPGHSVESPDRAWDILQADGALQFYGWRDLVFEAHKNWRYPFWNPYELGGTPLLANSQSAPYYPPHLVPAFLPFLQTGPYIVFLAWLHLAIAGIGTFCLARRLGAGIEGALFGGFALALSPFAISWSALASVMTACCWIPVLLAAQLSLIQKPSWRTALATCGAAAMLLTAGHLQFIFYGLFAWIVFAAVAFFTQPEKPKPAFTLIASALALGFAGFAALPQINPVLEFSKLSHRKTVASEGGYAAYAASAVKPWEFLGTLAPGFMGIPGKFDSEDAETKIPASWIMYAKPGGNYAESAVWLGVPVVLGLCMLGRRQNWKQLSPILAVGGIGLLLALGTPLAKLLYFAIPGFASTGSPGRAAILFVLGACVLAALAIPKDAEKSNPQAKAFPYFGLLGLAILTILASTQLTGLQSWLGLEIGPIIARRTTETLPLLVMALLAAAGAWFLWAKKGWLTAGTLCALAAHLIAIPLFILPFGTPPKASLPNDLQIRSAFVNGDWAFFGPPASGTMPPNFATIARTPEIGGYDSLMAASTVEILREINRGEDPAPPTNGNMMFVKPGFDPTALAEAGVTTVYSKFPLEGLGEAETIGDARVYNLPGPGLFSANNATIESVSITTEGIELRVKGDQRLEAKFADLPGWQAVAHGQNFPLSNDMPIEVTGGRWVGVDLPGGTVGLTLKYVPPGFLPWPWLPAIIGVLALISLLIPTKPGQISENPVESNSSELETEA